MSSQQQSQYVPVTKGTFATEPFVTNAWGVSGKKAPSTRGIQAGAKLEYSNIFGESWIAERKRAVGMLRRQSNTAELPRKSPQPVALAS